MNFLQERIEKDGRVLSERVLKVDHFLNHSIDTALIDQIGKAFSDYFKDQKPTKVLTIESGGIAPAFMTAFYLNIPLVYAKKALPSTMDHPISTEVYSFTKQKTYTICMEQDAIEPGDRVLFIDDFLADGQAFKGVENLIAQTNSVLCGCGFCIEKSFQKGRSYLLEKGYPFYSLAPIQKMVDGKIYWLED